MVSYTEENKQVTTLNTGILTLVIDRILEIEYAFFSLLTKLGILLAQLETTKSHPKES